jgi:hypothetical protein
MFLLYHSEGCNICELVLHECYVNNLYTTTCSGMLGHHTVAMAPASNGGARVQWWTWSLLAGAGVSRGGARGRDKACHAATLPLR